MALSQREEQQVDHANATGNTPAVFIHGLWLLPSSWDRWASVFEEAGYTPVTPDWPDDPETVEQARANPEALAKRTSRRSPTTPPK
jgi:non-heme chloroperoxidase